MKATGFTEVKREAAKVSAKRAKWVAAAAPLKRKKVVDTSSNPWASLQTSSDVAVIYHYLDSFR